MPAMVKNRSKRWRGRSCFRWLPVLVICAWMTQSVDSITGSHVCMEKQKYNVTKRIKYRAPMAVRTYEWCLAVPPRCSRWSTEMRDLTRLETEERTAEIAVCCPGFVMRSATCQPKCPSGKTGHNCTEQCRKKLWGPSCSKECADCPPYSSCSPVTGNCVCDDERKGERCEQVITDTTVAPTNTTVPLSSGIRTSERVIPTNRDYSSSTVNTVVTKNTPATTLIPQTKKFTTAKAQGSQQLFSVAQDLDFSTENSIPTFNNTSRSFDDQMETTEMATTQWIVTKSPFLTTTNHKTSSENLSTFKTPQADNLNLTIQPQLEVSSIMPSTKIEITTKSAKFMTTQPNNKPKEIWIKPTQKEPEHITAVVGDAGSERNTDNLLTVLSLAGGVMFAVITVAIVIVMIERCRRSKYEELMKLHNMRRKALEGEEDPPPYVRSIFHTPLPDPPITEKSHYQPISTLDRNVKQFMRPVAVHSISPIMLENFRGILECHYDHLPPRRSHISFKSDTLSCQYRCSTTPSMECASELCPQHSPLSEKTLPVTDLSVETLKHEGTVEMIDLSTAEPLYAEIPCWRPASQHAIEVVNLNGEAVTEL